MSQATTKTTQPVVTPEQYPSLMAHAHRSARLTSALAVVNAGLEEGMIRNQSLKDAKDSISDAVRDTWQKMVSDKFICGGLHKTLPYEVRDLYEDINLYSLHDVIATSKKLKKTKAEGPAVDAMKALAAELLPLAEAVASLKDKIVKGRAPSEGPAKPVNPNKVVKTCPWCFRSIAVVCGTMAHHGYQRPGHGYQTSSCPGIRFKPLEVSSEGLERLIDAHKAEIASLESEAFQLGSGTKTALSITDSRTGKKTVIRREDDQAAWEKARQKFLGQCESQIRALTGMLAQLEVKLANWKPSE